LEILRGVDKKVSKSLKKSQKGLDQEKSGEEKSEEEKSEEEKSREGKE